MKKWVLGLVFILALSSFPAFSANPPKPGSVCSKQGITKTYKGKKYTCIKSGKKLLWNKGLAVKTAYPQVTPAPTPTPSPIPTPTPTPTPSWKETEREYLNNASACKPTRPVGIDESYAHYGFPRGAHFLPSQGSYKALIIPVDFLDARAKVNTQENSVPYIDNFKRYWFSMSRGKVQFEIDTLPNWISLPKTAREYAGEFPHSPQMRDYANLVISIVDPEVNFANYKIVYIIPPDYVQNFFAVGPVVSSGNGNYFKSAEGPINNLVIGTNPGISMGGIKWKWLAHETGHLFGLAHPHSYENNDKRLASIFSIMDFGFIASELYGYERWLIDWIPEDSIRCFDLRNQFTFRQIHRLSPLGSGVGSELLAFRISERKALIIESRIANEFDSLPKNYEGILVYEVDSSKLDGAIKPILGNRYEIDQSKPEYNGARVVGTLRVGEFVQYEGITISILDRIGDLFVIGALRG